MIIKARYNVQLGGHIYAKGETLDYGGPVTGRIAANFTELDGKPLIPAEANPPPEGRQGDGKTGESTKPDTEAQIERTVKILGRKGVIQKLEELGTTFPPTATTKYLAKLLLIQQGEINPPEE